MLVRLVQLHIRPSEVDRFRQLFENHHEAIRSNPGCLSLELLAQEGKEGSLATLSRWKSEDDLNHYRNSAFFRTLWAEVKPLFSEPAQPFSYFPISSPS